MDQLRFCENQLYIACVANVFVGITGKKDCSREKYVFFFAFVVGRRSFSQSFTASLFFIINIFGLFNHLSAFDKDIRISIIDIRLDFSVWPHSTIISFL